MKPEATINPGASSEHAAFVPLEQDSKPMTAEEFANARRIPRVATLRRALGLTQEQFSARFKIPLGTLRDWEQGRVEPDATARAYLLVIAGNAKAVSEALLTAE